MKSSNTCQPFARLFAANMKWAKILCRAALVAAFAIALPNAVRAQTQLLVNPNWETGNWNANTGIGWTLVNNAIGNDTVNNSSQTYYNSSTGACPPDATAENVNVLTGTQCGKVYPGYNGNPISGYLQTFAAAPGSTWSAGGFGYSSHEDLMSSDNFWYELDFYSGTNGTGTLLAAYESFEVESLTCHETTPFLVDAWNGLPVTNVMQVTTGTNTATVTGNIAPGTDIVAPASAASVAFKVVFQEVGGGGSMYVDNATLYELTATAASASAAPSKTSHRLT